MARENWDRWGEEDERGALNWLTPGRVAAAARLVRRGQVFALGQPLGRSTRVPPHRLPPVHFMDRDGGDYAAGARRPGGFQFAEDTLLLAAHTGTHMDALAHCWYDDHLYNGFPGSTVRSTTGAKRCGIDKAGPVVGRGVLLDLPRLTARPLLPAGHEVTAGDLADCARSQGVTIGAGDIILVRTGWAGMAAEPGYFDGEPGPGLEAARWLADRHIAALGADNYSLEVLPRTDGAVFPVHQFLIRDCGVPLLEGLRLDELAAESIYEFLFVAAPLPIAGGTASPLNPLAII